MIDGQIVKVAVRQDGQPERARLQVNLTGGMLTERTQMLTKSLLERMLSLRRDLTSFYKLQTGEA
jgi:hypothetical protein